MRTFSTEFRLPCALEEAFDLFGDARNLSRVTPAWFQFEILTPTPIRMAEGTRIDYRLRWRLLTFRWQSLVTEWRPPHRFVYEQARGPFRHFRHDHRFEADGEGVRVRDRVDYSLPGQRWLGPCLVDPDLRRIFRHRARAAASLLAS